ncbi:unnamed protein product, partial [Phaeothamnion confervicola]
DQSCCAFVFPEPWCLIRVSLSTKCSTPQKAFVGGPARCRNEKVFERSGIRTFARGFLSSQLQIGRSPPMFCCRALDGLVDQIASCGVRHLLQCPLAQFSCLAVRKDVENFRLVGFPYLRHGIASTRPHLGFPSVPSRPHQSRKTER